MESMLVVEQPGYKNYTFSITDDMYIASVEDAESDGYDFQTSVMTDSIQEDWSFEQVGTIELPVYKVVKRVAV